MAKDMEFLSGNFMDMEVPKGRHYLTPYFKNEHQLAFLKYILVFGHYSNFVDHTGIYISKSLRVIMFRRYLQITNLYFNSKKAFTEEGLGIVGLIESGQLKTTKYGWISNDNPYLQGWTHEQIRALGSGADLLLRNAGRGSRKNPDACIYV